MNESTAITFAQAKDPHANKNVRDVIRSLLIKQKVWEKIAPFLTNGGKAGHKVMDLTHAVIILREADEAIGMFGLNDFQLGNALKMTLRERLELNKAWKIVGERKLISAKQKPEQADADDAE